MTRELLATGEKVREREVDTYSQLTPQEEHIVRLARTDAPTPRLPRNSSSAPAPSNELESDASGGLVLVTRPGLEVDADGITVHGGTVLALSTC